MTISTVLPDTAVSAYERDLAEYLGVTHAVAVSSGTAALQCALDAVGVKPGDEVLLPALAVVMSVAPVLHLGARPVFVDCNPDGIDFDYDDLAAKVTDRAVAVMPVYLWGRAGNTTLLRAFAIDRGLAVVADACQALGTTTAAPSSADSSVQVGVDADVACFSTHELKLLATGEGGFLTTNDDYYAARARAYRSHWLVPPASETPLSRIAHNFRLAAPLAEIGRRELARLDMLVEQRIELTSLLLDLLRDVPQATPAAVPAGQRWNHYAPLLHLHCDRPRAFSEHLAQCGVPNSTGSFTLIPLDQRPMFTSDTPPACTTTAAFLDGILAVVLTRDDDQHRVRDYAETLTQEVTRWGSV